MASWFSWHLSFRPNPAQRETVWRRCRINFRQSASVLLNHLTSVPGGNTARRQSLNGLSHFPGVILDQRVGEAGFVALLATHQAPDQVFLAGAKLVDAVPLLNHCTPIQ